MKYPMNTYRLETAPVYCGTRLPEGYEPTAITFNAINQKGAEKKAHRFIRDAEIRNCYYRVVQEANHE